MQNLTGTHGTCVTHAENIKKTGCWNPTHQGRAGSGVYLWAHSNSSSSLRIARGLAISWWQHALKMKRYEDAPNKNGAIIYAAVAVPAEAFFDSTDMKFQDALIEALETANPDEAFEPDNICKVTEYLILELEKINGKKFDVIQARVPPPHKADFKEKIIIGNPFCYIIRNTVNTVQCKKLEELKI